MLFGDRIKELRLKRGLTQDQFADMLEIKRPNITSYESNRNTPPLEVVTKIADLFNVSIDFLLGRTEQPYDTYGFLKINELTPEQREMFEKWAERTIELLRTKGELSEEKIYSVMKFMTFTYFEDNFGPLK